jgi:hypothetical protein
MLQRASVIDPLWHLAGLVVEEHLPLANPELVGADCRKSPAWKIIHFYQSFFFSFAYQPTYSEANIVQDVVPDG